MADYAFRYLPLLKDCRNRLKKHHSKYFRTRQVSDIKYIAIHHSQTKTGNAENFARSHVKIHGWPGIAYHFVIEKSGHIKWCHHPSLITYHVGRHNAVSLGICLSGDFREEQPSRNQWYSFYRLIRSLSDDFLIDVSNVLGHSEFPGALGKESPSLDMKKIRSKLEKRSVSVKAIVQETIHYSQQSNYIAQSRDNPNTIISKLNYLSPHNFRLLNKNLRGKKVTPGQVIKIQGPTSNFDRLPVRIRKIYFAMKKKDYLFFEKDEKPFNLNIIGIRNDNNIPNQFDDSLVIIWKHTNQWHFRIYKATTDPGLYYLENPIDEEVGTAILKEGQYQGVYRVGKHKSYIALEQFRPITVVRDFNRDNKLNFKGGRISTGLFKINIHRANSKLESKVVGKWSAGCQVLANPNEFADLINLTKKAIRYWGNSFTYTLLNINDLR